MRSTWTDERLDEFKDRVDSRLDELSQRVDGLSGRIDNLQHTMVHGFIAIMVAMVTGFVALAGLIAAQM
jgi:tetrahydromethanopterin S-methyltransferase subunit G